MIRVTASAPLRFRQNGAFLVAVMIAFVGTIPLAAMSWAFAPLILIPLMVGGWAWRSGTDIDAHELRVRALFGTRHIPWTRVVEVAADPRGGVSALLTDGHAIRLTAVRDTDLPAVARATGASSRDGGDKPGDGVDGHDSDDGAGAE
jgi:hypothetical protein